MADGWLAEAVESLHERLESVKARIRASPPSPEAVLERREAEWAREADGRNGSGSSRGDGSDEAQHGSMHGARAGPDAGTAREGKPEEAEVRRCSRCRRILGDDPFETDEGLYCHYCEQRILEEREGRRRRRRRKGGRKEDSAAESPQVLEEGDGYDVVEARCTRCRRELGDDPFVTDEGVFCHYCEQRILEQRGEATRAESRHGGHRGSPSSGGSEAGDAGGPGPTMEWKGRDLSALQRGIMKALREAYPGPRTAREITDRLAGGAEVIGGTDKSTVNSELYGTLSEWLEKEGEMPPHWSLRPGDSSEEDPGGQADRPSDASRGDVSVGDDADGYRLSGGRILSKQDQEDSVPDNDEPGPSDESSYELCSICVTEHPEAQVRAFRDQMICASCWEELGIGKRRDGPGDGA